MTIVVETAVAVVVDVEVGASTDTVVVTIDVVDGVHRAFVPAA